MFEKLNLNPTPNDSPGDVKASTSTSFNQAVNDARFVKAFGITALIYALTSSLGMPLLGGGLGVGAGLFIMRYDDAKYYRVLGIVVIVFALLGAMVPFLGAGVLSAAILLKGLQVLRVFSTEGREDEEWAPGQKRALIGTVSSGIGTGVSVILMVLFTVRLIVIFLNQGA